MNSVQASQVPVTSKPHGNFGAICGNCTRMNSLEASQVGCYLKIAWEVGLVGGTRTRGILLPKQACWLLHYDQLKIWCGIVGLHHARQ